MEPEAQLATVSTSCCDLSSSASSRVDPTLDRLTSFYLVESLDSVSPPGLGLCSFLQL